MPVHRSVWTIRCAVLLGLVLGFSGVARAIPIQPAPQTTYLLTLNGCSSGCGTGPYGSVTVSQDARIAGALDFSVVLGAGYSFRHANDTHHTAFGFDLAGNPQITMSSFSSSVFSRGNDNLSLSPFGVMEYSIGCASTGGLTCASGANANNPTTLAFVVTSQTGALTLSSLVANPDGYLFTVDAVNNGTCAGCTSGSTGNLAAAAAASVVTNDTLATPEPATAALFGTGLLALGGLVYRRRRG